MNIFSGLIGVQEFFSFNFPLRAFFLKIFFVEIWKFEIDFKKSRFSRLRSTLACTPLTKSEKKRCCPALLIKEIDTESQFENYVFRYSKNPLCPVLLDMTFHCFMPHLGLPSPGEVLQNFK